MSATFSTCCLVLSENWTQLYYLEEKNIVVLLSTSSPDFVVDVVAWGLNNPRWETIEGFAYYENFFKFTSHLFQIEIL